MFPNIANVNHTHTLDYLRMLEVGSGSVLMVYEPLSCITSHYGLVIGLLHN